jgi:hypothetical protein
MSIEDEKWVHKDLIPEDKDAHLEEVNAVDNDKFVVKYKRNVSWISLFSSITVSHTTAGQGRDLYLRQ